MFRAIIVDYLSGNEAISPSRLTRAIPFPANAYTTSFSISTVLNDKRILLCKGGFYTITTECWTYDYPYFDTAGNMLQATPVASTSVQRWQGAGVLLDDGKFWIVGGDLTYYIN